MIRGFYPALLNIIADYNNLVENLGIKFDLDEILGLFNKGIRILREVKDTIVLTNAGNYGEAIRQVDEIVKISKETNKNEYADAMSLLGYVYLVMGDYQKSLQNFEEALRSFDLRDKNFEGSYYLAKVYYAKVLAELGRVEEAKLIAEEIGEKIGELKLIPQVEETIKQIIDEIKQYSNG
jgi:Tetratricopeptide repeat.